MARTRATDYDHKRRAILDKAAELFAEEGFDRTSISQISAACGVSKALVYHYYNSKDDLVFDVIGLHLKDLVSVVQAADNPSLAPEDRLLGLVTAILEAYRGANAEHKVQINALSQLPKDRSDELKNMERQLVSIFAKAIASIDPGLGQNKGLLMPVTMSLFGMLNWHYMWYRPEGSMSRQEYAEMVTKLIVTGARALL